MRYLQALTAILALSATVANAEPSSRVGIARLFSNDFFGDGQDRWHTGSYAFSVLKKTGGVSGAKLDGIDDVLELRLRSEIIAPSNLARPSRTDRPYAGVLSFGVHRHSQRRGLETSLGLDLVTVGNQTGLLNFQREFHQIFGGGNFGTVNQIGNAVYPTVLGEIARTVALGRSVSTRPFLQAQAGVETLLRAGVDFDFGRACNGPFKVRDVTTGQRYSGFSCKDNSSTVVTIGIDAARVFDSHYLPGSSGYRFTKTRPRIRIGIHKNGKSGDLFFGLAWLGKEFVGQPTTQVVGSLSLNFRF
jgi:hypothetical protein